MGRRVGKRGSVGVSMDAGKVFKVIGYIIFSPFLLTYYVCVWPFIAIVKLSKKKKAAAPARATVKASPGAAVSLPYSFEAKSWYAHKRAIMSICRRVPAFQQGDDEFLRKHTTDRRVWQYKFTDAAGELVPEPTNDSDPDAIMVVVDGQTVGYVPRDKTAAVRALIRRPHEADVSIHGGPWKRNNGGMVEVGEYDFTVKVTIREPSAAARSAPAPAPVEPAPEPEPEEAAPSVDDILADLSWLD